MPSSNATRPQPSEAEQQKKQPPPKQEQEQHPLSAHRPASRVVGAFEVTQTKLGTGQFAKVYLGYHIKERYKVAVKAVDLRIVQKPYAEVKELSRLQRERTHPNIVRLYDTHQNDKFLCAFLEFCEGGDLHQRMEKLRHQQRKQAAATAAASKTTPSADAGGAPESPPVVTPLLDEFTVQRIGAQLLDGLCFLNENHIMHRDLKPANLLLTDKDIHKADVRIADLGFARAGSEGSMMMESCIGTAFYMAPERLRSDRYDFQAEVWAAGLILYELLYGKHPFPARGFMELARMTESQPVTFPETTVAVSDSFKDLMRHMIVADPKRRITIEAARSHLWFQEALDAPPQTPSPQGDDVADEKGKDENDDTNNNSAVEDRQEEGTPSSEQQPNKVNSPNIARGDLGSNSDDDDGEGDDDGEANPTSPMAAVTASSARADAGTSPLRTAQGARRGPPREGNKTDDVSTRHVDPSSFSVALMHEEPPVQGLPPPQPTLAAARPDNTAGFYRAPPPAGDYRQQSRHSPHASSVTGTSPPMVYGHAANSSFVEAFALPPSNQSMGGGGGGYRNNGSLVGSAGTVGSFCSRTHGSSGGAGTSPVPTSSFALQPQANAVPLYNFMQGRPMLEMARIVAWAARENPKAANRAQLYHYAALVATSFDFSSHCSSEIADFRDECIALGARHGANAMASSAASSPCAPPPSADAQGASSSKKERSASSRGKKGATFDAEAADVGGPSAPQNAAVRTPRPHVLALQTAIDWMHVVHDPTVAQHFNVAEIDAIFKGAATLCEVVRDDPNAGESGTSTDAGHMKDLILARWDRVREGLRDGGHCGAQVAALSIS